MRAARLSSANHIRARVTKSPRWATVLLGVAILLIAGPAFAQKNKKDQNKQAPAQTPVVSLPDDSVIETEISGMLATWQIGDAERMHTYYADDVVVVSGGFEPPILGWTNYVASYQTQRAHMQSVRMERTDTAIKVTGDSAWATYQWEFSGLVDNKKTMAQGHTTLVLAKRNGKWLIVLNHTSVVTDNMAAPAAKAGTS